MAISCITIACARGGGDDSASGDDGGPTSQDSSVIPEATTEGSARDGAAHDSMALEAASHDSAVDAPGDDAPGDAWGFDGTSDPDTQAGVDSGAPDTGPGQMDSGIDTGMDTGTTVHDAGNDTTTNLPACVTAYDSAKCLEYVTGTTEVSSSSHNWFCSGPCANCADHADCAPGQSGCPWGVVWMDKGACH